MARDVIHERGIGRSGYTASHPRVSTAPPLTSCPGCRRPTGQPCDSWCTVGGTEDQRHTETMFTIRPDRKEPAVPTLAETTAALGLPAPSTEAPAVEMADCQKCGPAPRANFSSRKDGSPYAICRPCKAETMRAHRYDGKCVTQVTKEAPIPQEVAETAYAAMTEPPVIDQSAPAPMAVDLVEEHREDETASHPEMALALEDGERERAQLATPAPIDADIDQLEARLRDLRDIKNLMGDTLVGLERWQRLVAEAIVRKQSEMGVTA